MVLNYDLPLTHSERERLQKSTLSIEWIRTAPGSIRKHTHDTHELWNQN
jgi:hypothetical protein